MSRTIAIVGVILALAFPTGMARAESQEDEYLGVTDPFGDPSNYEFAEDEKADKEFFHLGRFLMLGIDIGAGIFTGGLGSTTNPGMYFGAHLLYFFDRIIAFEAAAHYANHLDSIRPNQTESGDINTDLIPITVGLRYYFDTRSAPSAIAAANPYLAAGGGIYIRRQEVIDGNLPFANQEADTSQFGFYAGGGIEFSIYRRHVYLGIDARFHFVFFTDEDDTLNGKLQEGDRAGDYFTPTVTLTYNF